MAAIERIDTLHDARELGALLTVALARPPS
jgi:hypothetical protein